MVRLPRPRSIALAVFMLLVLPCGYVNMGDGIARYKQTLAILQHGTLSIPQELAGDLHDEFWSDLKRADDGRIYSKYAIGISVVWLIPAAIAWGLSNFGLPFDPVAQGLISLINPIVVLATVSLLNRSWRRLGVSIVAARLGIAAYLGGCCTFAYANTADVELPCGLLILWIVNLTMLDAESQRRMLLGGFICAVLCAFKLEMVLILLIVSMVLLAQRRWEGLIRFALIGSVGPVAMLLANYFLRGGFFAFSYGAESGRFGSPLSGLKTYFLTLDKNILLFNPSLVLAVIAGVVLIKRSRRRPLVLCVSALWIVFTLLYAAWWVPDGGWSYGPRFLQSLMAPAMLVTGLGIDESLGIMGTAGTRLLKAGVIFVIAIGLLVQTPGMCVKDRQAIMISKEVDRPQLLVQSRLLWLKLRRGPASPEVYRVSDFRKVSASEQDVLIDHRTNRSFQWLNQWWSLALLAGPPDSRIQAGSN